MVQVPAEVPTTPNDAPDDAQPRADSERMLGFIDALLRANGETMIRQADDNARLVERVVNVERDNARLLTERDNALARAAEANEELSHLRIDLRRQRPPGPVIGDERVEKRRGQPGSNANAPGEDNDH